MPHWMRERRKEAGWSENGENRGAKSANNNFTGNIISVIVMMVEIRFGARGVQRVKSL